MQKSSCIFSFWTMTFFTIDIFFYACWINHSLLKKVTVLPRFKHWGNGLSHLMWVQQNYKQSLALDDNHSNSSEVESFFFHFSFIIHMCIQGLVHFSPLPPVRWNLNVVWFTFPLWPGVFNISSSVFWPFVLLSFKKFCLVHLPISPLGHWFFKSLVFWILCKFWLLILCLTYSWQRFSPILWGASLIWWAFPFLCRSFLASCSPDSEWQRFCV
jgi:hypothetical protein